jgi:hypothetical protein
MSTTPPDICTDTTYLNSIDQKKRFQLFNIPANRYDNLSTSPYNKINPNTGKPYTKFDLDMRRKAEILKYNSNRMSTQTNNLTKAQKFALAVNGYSQQSTYSQSFINANIENGIVNTCPPGTIVQMPSSASDVPGTLLLYDDPTIPLYNITNDTSISAYGIINQQSNPYQNGFQYSNQTNVIYNGQKSTNSLFTIYMFNTPTKTYAFSFTSPILIEFFSNLNSSSTIPPTGSVNSFQIILNSINVNVNYSLSPMSLKSTISYKINNTEIISQPLLLEVNVNPNAFNGSYYLGTINVSNIVLPVNLGYIYDFQLIPNFSVIYPSNSVYTTYFYTPTISSVSNVTSSIIPSATNCIITPNTSVVVPPGTPYSTFSVSGTTSLSL